MEGNTVEGVQDAKKEFSECLQEIMDKRNLFDPVAHAYLTDLMAHYIFWEQDRLKPSIHTRESEPVVFQLNGINEDVDILFDNSKWADRLASIGGTLLVSVGYWPESITSRPGRNKPPLEYYAAAGASAYSRANSIRQEAVLEQMASGFRQYAGVLHHFRSEMGSAPKNIDILFKLADFLRDETVLRRYVLDITPEYKILH